MNFNLVNSYFDKDRQLFILNVSLEIVQNVLSGKKAEKQIQLLVQYAV